jgi:glycosyltransferase involved in cell wall biosynthesis
MIKTLGIILGNYPEPSETFIRREIVALLESLGTGYEIQIIAVGKLLKNDLNINIKGIPPPLSVHCLNPIKRFLDTASIKNLIKKVKNKNIVHLHAHFLDYPAKTALALSKHLDIPLSVSLHAADIFKKGKFSDPEIFKRADAFFCCSEYLKKIVLKKYTDLDEKKIKVMYHGLDFSKGDRKTNQETNKKKGLMLAVGRNREKKGFAILLSALEKVSEDFHLKIITDKAPHIQASLKNKVEILAWMPAKEICSHYEQAELLIVPSIKAKNGDQDNIPNVILEAMSAGCVPIASNLAGIPEAIENKKDGLLVNSGDAVELATTINKLLKDSKNLATLSGKARHSVREKFDITQNIQPLLKLIKKK